MAEILSTSLSMEKVSNATDEYTLLSGIGDRELWYAEGEVKDDNKDGGPDWRFPLFIDWKTDQTTGIEYAMVYPALCPHYKAMLTLKALFETHDRLGHDGRWLVRKNVVEAILKKAPGITPDKYYRWDGNDRRGILFTQRLQPGRSEPAHTKGRGMTERVLVQQVAEECGLQTSVVKIVMDGLNKVAADYLVTQRRVMDLGFIKLVALPFRANWKEIVFFKLRKLGLLHHLKEDGQEPDPAEHAHSGNNGGGASLGLPETLCSPHNVALIREKAKKGIATLSRVDYSIELTTSKAFEKEVTRLETKQRSLGHTAYVNYYEQTVKKLYGEILEILRAYRKKIGHPFARVCEGGSTGGLRFVETSGIRARAHGHNLRHLPVHIVPPARGFSAIAETSQQELVCEKAPEVPEVPAVSKEEGARDALDDVRECDERGTLEEFSNWEGGTGGLPLSDVDQSEAARQPMLSQSAVGRGPSWVEIIGD